MNPFILLILFLTSFACTHRAYSSSEDDKIQFLPGLRFKPRFNQYSGYLQGINDNYQLHYWFVESQKSPTKDPLVLWLNGGPGCSSLAGLFTENGPFMVSPGKVLIHNKYSWNKIANVLYIESPAGVGFSYAKNNNFSTDDDFTALNNLAALKSFFVKFPQYKGFPFYITGESYAGIYIPTLARLVLNTPGMNLQAVAIGNGLFNYKLNDNSAIYFSRYHGILSQRNMDDLLNACCKSEPATKCMFTDNESQACQLLISKAASQVTSYLNPYNIYKQCTPPEQSSHGALANSRVNDIHGQSGTHFSHFGQYITADMSNLFRNNRYVQFQRMLLHQSRTNHRVAFSPPCTDDSVLSNYLNDKSVQQAIHVATNTTWGECNLYINDNYVRSYFDVSRIFNYLLNNSIRIIVYNGDIDSVCNYLGGEWFVDQLDLKLLNPYHAWFYKDQRGWNQVAGWTKTFTSSVSNATLIYTTIRGSGHMVPEDASAPALKLFTTLLNDQPL